MVTVPHKVAGLERLFDYRGVTVLPPVYSVSMVNPSMFRMSQRKKVVCIT